MGKIPFTAITILLLICSALNAQGQQNATTKATETKKEVKNDSTKTKAELDSIKLGEVVVTANNIRVENGKVVMTPTKQEKNLSRNITSLIENMNTGILTVDDGKIKTSGGQSVSLFINGEPVNKFDESTFWAKNVLNVEYIPNPDDPKYLGSNQVINIVMKEYKVGGLTKLDGTQTIPNLGYYTAASKLVVGKMTYNVIFKGGYSIDHRENEIRTENYKDVWYDGVKYDNITRTEESTNTTRENRLSTGLNARYKNEKLTATHAFNFSRKENPETFNSGAVFYSPEIISGNKMERSNFSKNYTYGLDGNYLYKFTPTLGIRAIWGVNYTKNCSLTSYSETGLNPIINDISEDVWSGNFSFLIGKNFTKKIYTSFTVSEAYTNYNTLYSGTGLSNQKQKVSNTDILAYLYYQPVEKLTLTLTPKLSIYSRNINQDYKKTDFMPGIDFQAYYTINQKSYSYLGLNYYLMNPGTSQTNDLILRQTELKWIEGSPSIKTNQFYYLFGGYNIMPVKWYTMTLFAAYMLNRNQTYLSYYSGGENYDGVIGKYINGISHNNYRFSISMVFKPFNGKLNLKPQLSYSRHCYKNIKPFNDFSPRFSANFFAGNWNISAGVDSPTKIIQDGSTKTEKRPWNYYMNLNYGNGNLNVHIGLNNIFSKRNYTYIYLNNGPYSYDSKKLEDFWNRSVTLSLTYTFDYGKKVDKSIDISASENKTTSILSTY